MKWQPRFVLALVALLSMLLPRAAAAQVKPDDAKAFLGGWTIGLDTPQGAMTMNLTVKDDSGKVAAVIQNDMLGESPISDVSKSGESLVLKYLLDVQGMQIPAKITMTPAGDKMNCDFDFADGQFQLPATATKK